MLYQHTFQAEETTSETGVSTGCYRSAADSTYPLHCHAYYELSYVWSGERYENYQGQRYPVGEGSLFFLEPLMIHGNQNITPVQDMVIQFSVDFLWTASSLRKTNTILGLAQTEQPYIVIEEHGQIRDLLQEIHQLCSGEEKITEEVSYFQSALREWRVSSLVLQLLAALAEQGFLVLRESSINHWGLQSLGELINRILTDPAKIPNMTEASSFVGMSYYHFSRFFQKMTGVHYQEYCNLLRLQYAENRLLNSTESVTEIACEIGIDTASYFTRFFKKHYGMSPMQFRQQHKQK